jgi:serpin B
METEGFQALELPYVENELSMIVFLPKKMDGLAELEKSFTADNLAKWLPELHKQEVQVELPRFKMTSEFRLDQVLKSMGMTDAFSLPPADFSGMDGKKDLFISAVLHKAFVDVNEEGTEAAAATAVVVGMTAAPAEPLVFRADHPFLFLIRDNRTGSILFMGRVTNPQ